MRTLIAPTEDFIKGERDKLTANASAGSSVALSIENSAHLAVNDFICIGQEGTETAEIAKITEITSATAIKVNTLTVNHKSGEPITKFRFDKRKFYGATTVGGSYSELTGSGSPIAIMVNNPQGTLCEYVGVEGYTYFKATYYNSVSTLETDTDDSEAVLADDSTRYTSLYAIRVQAGLTNNPFIDDGRIERKRIQAENEINSIIFVKYLPPLPEIPPLVQRLCELLAAGFIDFEEYGPEGQGVKWLGEARGILKNIKENKQILLDSTGEELPQRTLMQGIVSYPDTIDDTNGPRQYFKMGQRF